MRIVEVREREALAALQATWCALQTQCPQATPYQTWEWNEAWWRHFGARKRLRLMLFYSGDRPDTVVGIAPLYTSRHLGTPIRRLAWLGTGLSDYLGPIALPEYETQVAQLLLKHIRSGLHGWDMADLQQLHCQSPLLSSATTAPELYASAGSCIPMEPCPYLTLPATWEELAARLGKKMRSNLGYYERLLYKTFADACGFMATADTLHEGMSALFELHQKRWNARWLPGVLGNRRVQAFHLDVAARFLEQGWLRLHLLRAEDALRAALYCFSYCDRTYYYLGGFAPEYGKYSLGTLLTGWAIRQAIAEHHTEFDFLRGSEPYKYRWLPAERINHRLLLLRKRDGLGSLGALPGRAGFALNRVERYVEHRAKAFAEQQGRKERGAEAPPLAAGKTSRTSAR